MGTVLLGTLPNTAKWRRVVNLIAATGSVHEIAEATMDAAHKAIGRVPQDAGVQAVVFLLTRVALAAREKDFAVALNKHHFDVPANPSVWDVVSGLDCALEIRLGNRHPTDSGTMAKLAAVESLTKLGCAASDHLFSDTGADGLGAMKKLSTEAGFSRLGRQFFSRFLQRFMGYYLEREMSCHVGPQSRFVDPMDHNRFRDELAMHCDQTAVVVEKFSGAWYSKMKFETGIREDDAQKFVHGAISKIFVAMQQRRLADA